MSECSSKLNSWVNSFIYALTGQCIRDLVNENHFMRKLSICTSGFHKTINWSMEFLIRKLFALIVIARVTQHFINKLVPQKWTWSNSELQTDNRIFGNLYWRQKSEAKCKLKRGCFWLPQLNNSAINVMNTKQSICSGTCVSSTSIQWSNPIVLKRYANR